ncbi:MAG: pentapeptide repeat-containing protein [Pseudomonadota bacterium]
MFWAIAGAGAFFMFFVLWWKGRAWGLWCATYAMSAKFWLQRNYLWIIVPAALLAYGILLGLVTWELPFIADAALIQLTAAIGNDSNDVRNYAYALTALMGGIALLATVPFQLIKTWVNERQAKTAEQGHITDRLTRAIEQLGAEKTQKQTDTFRVRSIEYDMPAGDESHRVEFQHREGDPFTIPKDVEHVDFGDWQTVNSMVEKTVPNLEVRLGAIYALERIAQDSERDHITVMETLCAYIRENAPASSAQNHDLGDWPDMLHESMDDSARTRAERLNERELSLLSWTSSLEPPRVDIQATLTVIGRRSAERIKYERTRERPFQINLSSTNLQRADLKFSKLTEANLSDCRLDGSDLRSAEVEGGAFWRAQLLGADLSKVNGHKAYFSEAIMQGARMRDADLSNSNFFSAKLQGADLSHSVFDYTLLDFAELERTNFHASKLSLALISSTHFDKALVAGADLMNPDFLQSHANHCYGDAATLLPERVVAPDHWSVDIYNPSDVLADLIDGLGYKIWQDEGAPPGKPRLPESTE